MYCNKWTETALVHFLFAFIDLNSHHISVAAQAKPAGSHNTSFTVRRGVVAPVRNTNAIESVALDDLINMQVLAFTQSCAASFAWSHVFNNSCSLLEETLLVLLIHYALPAYCPAVMKDTSLKNS